MVGCCRASVEPISGTWLGHPLELNRPLVGAEFVPFAAPAVPDDGTSLAGGGMRLQSATICIRLTDMPAKPPSLRF